MGFMIYATAGSASVPRLDIQDSGPLGEKIGVEHTQILSITVENAPCGLQFAGT